MELKGRKFEYSRLYYKFKLQKDESQNYISR